MKTLKFWIESHEEENRPYLYWNSPLREKSCLPRKNMAMEKPWQSGGTLGAKYFIVGRAAWNQ